MAILNTDNLISNLSYTEKDFQVIYPALLDLVRKLTSKWDPSASNESDPGVLLLKLNAIIADKLNYNIDKNVLECFPVSVTQDQNARQLFEQLGYYMHWYKAATTNVTLRYIGNPIVDTSGEIVTKLYTIPRFTMVTDNDSNIVYTITSTGNLSTNGTPITLTALQGIAKEFTVNNESLITVANLDSNNRLYFDSNTVAENGIFIRNADSDNYSVWVKKDNLLIEEVSATNTFYKFGLSQDLNTSYIEFPENVEELMQEGIYITYIDTNGAEGNIATNILNKFYTNIVVADGEDFITLSNNEVSINNYVVGAFGADPESIDDAYINYKKVVGTFDTLITLRDYMNVIRRSAYVSNAVVSDRTTDVQVAYKIMSKIDSLDAELVELENKQPYDVIAELIDNEFRSDEYIYTPDPKLNYYDTITNKCYRAILKSEKNPGTLVETVTHQYIESDPIESPALTAFELKSYILSATAVMKSAADYNTTFELNTDSSIQSVVEAELNDYKCVQHNFVDLLPNKICIIKNKYPINCKIIPQYALTVAQRDEILANIQQALYDGLNSSKIEFGEEIAYDVIYDLISEADARIKAIALEPLVYTSYVVYLKPSSVDPSVYDLVEENLSEYITKLDDATNLTYKIDWDNIINQFRTEIYAKSVLAGKTQFFIPDTTFNYSLEQNYCLLESNVGHIKTSLDIPLDASVDWQYTLKENEALQAFAPNLIETESFSTNVKFEYHLTTDVLSGTSYMLKDDEYVIFYWVPAELEGISYNYTIYGKGAIIKPTFNLTKSINNTTDLIGASLINKCQLVTKNNQSYLYSTGNIYYEGADPLLEAKIKAISGTLWADNILSNNKIIYILVKNSIVLDSSSYYCYWILNKETNGKYVLFDDEIGTERILTSGEYFIYSTNTSSEMFILGAGTHIQRILNDGESPIQMSCPVIDYSTIVSEGLFALTDRWISINKSSSLLVTEMQYVALNEGTIVKISPKETVAVQVDEYTKNEVKYEHNIKSKIPANTYYVLNDDEYIIFYKQNLDSIITDFKYTIYGKGTIVKFSEELAANDITSNQLKNSVLISLVKEQTVYKKQDLTNVKYTDRPYMMASGYLSEVQGTDITAVSTLLNFVNFDVEVSGYNTPQIYSIDLGSEGSKAAALAYCNIEYKNSISDTAWTRLPNISLDDVSYSWQGSTILKLNTSSSIPQELKAGQKLTIYKYDFDKNQVVTESMQDLYTEKQWEDLQPIIIDPLNTEKYDSPTYVLTSRSFSETSSSISTIMYDASNKPQAIELYAYLDTPKVNGVYTDLTTGNTVFEFNNASQKYNTKEVGFKLPAGSYILPISHNVNADILENLSFNLRIPADTNTELVNYYKVLDIEYNDSLNDYVLTLNEYKIKPESKEFTRYVFDEDASKYPADGYSINRAFYYHLSTDTNFNLWNQYTADHTELAVKNTEIEIEIPVESVVYKYGKKEDLIIDNNTISYNTAKDWVITKSIINCPDDLMIGLDNNFITGIDGDFTKIYCLIHINIFGSTKTITVKPYEIENYSDPTIELGQPQETPISAFEGIDTISYGHVSALKLDSENNIIVDSENVTEIIASNEQPFEVSGDYFIRTYNDELSNYNYYKVTRIESQDHEEPVQSGPDESHTTVIKKEWFFSVTPFYVKFTDKQRIIIKNTLKTVESIFKSTIWRYGENSALTIANTGIIKPELDDLIEWDLNDTNSCPWSGSNSNYYIMGIENDPKSLYQIQEAVYNAADSKSIKWTIKLKEYTTSGNPEAWIDVADTKSTALTLNSNEHAGANLIYGNASNLFIKSDNTIDAKVTKNWPINPDNTEVPFIGKNYFVQWDSKYFIVDDFKVEGTNWIFSIRDYVIIPGTKEKIGVVGDIEVSKYPDKDFADDGYYYERNLTTMYTWKEYAVTAASIIPDDEIIISTKYDLGNTCGYGRLDQLDIQDNKIISTGFNYWEPNAEPQTVNNIINFLKTSDSFIGGTATTQSLASMCDFSITNLNKPGKYYLKIEIPENKLLKNQYLSIVLKVILADSIIMDQVNPNIEVYMYPIYKYTKPKNLSSNTAWDNEIYEKIYEKIRLLDCNNKFNYTYVVNDDEKIVDPLDSKSFLDLNHPYNDYTICQINTATLANNLQITNIIK